MAKRKRLNPKKKSSKQRVQNKGFKTKGSNETPPKKESLKEREFKTKGFKKESSK
ncbi:hypothetical protein KYTH86_04340 [Helicobacter pylori]